jgi:hypothetical protein
VAVSFIGGGNRSTRRKPPACVLILPEDLTNITYGSYLLTLTLRGSPNTIETKDMIMFYEEAITGLMV